MYADPGAKLIQQAGIAFKAATRTKAYIAKKTIGEVIGILPVPTIFVIDTNGEILFEYLSPNYKKRISPKLLLAVLNNLN